MHRRWTKIIAGTAAGLLVSACAALGQQYEAPRPATGEGAAADSTALEWGIGAVFLVGCLVVAFKPTKRANLR